MRKKQAIRIDTLRSGVLTFEQGQRSSAEEQGTHKPLVAGSNPAAAILYLRIPILVGIPWARVESRRSEFG